MKSHRLVLILGVLVAGARTASAQDLAAFEKRVTTKTLANGLTFVVVERRVAPVVSFFTHVDVGAVQEVPGITGIAHMFEHMAFKGTHSIGTSDYAAEKKSLARVEAAYAAYDRERRREVGRDDAKLLVLAKAWKAAMREADKFVVRNELDEIIKRAGGVGLNAFTGHDRTGYFFSMPSNGVELWAHLESSRFLEPVMREFYKERSVVQEERRMRTDSQPVGRLIEQFLATAFAAHPYGSPVVGWASDLEAFSATDAMAFYRTHYVPANLVIAIVGDIDRPAVASIVERYFGRWSASPKPPPLRTVEPPQRAERTVVLREKAQPFYVEGYHKPDTRHPDDPVFAVIQDLMSAGRTSRLYRSLVRDKKISAVASGFNGYPGAKYPNLFAYYAVPTPGHAPAEVQAAIRAEIERLKTERVSDSDLKMVKTRVKARLIRSLGSNLGLAMGLASAQARYGDWRELFRRVEKIDRVSAEDIERVARATFVAQNRTVGIIESTRPASLIKKGGADAGAKPGARVARASRSDGGAWETSGMGADAGAKPGARVARAPRSERAEGEKE